MKFGLSLRNIRGDLLDKFSKEIRSKIMSRIRSESGIEKLPKCMKGLYLRKHPSGIYGKPDFGNKKRKIVVFIDGCFWHKCPIHHKEPKSNRSYWTTKINKNVDRDKEVNSVLKKEGWKVIRIWEHDLLK